MECPRRTVLPPPTAPTSLFLSSNDFCNGFNALIFTWNKKVKGKLPPQLPYFCPQGFLWRILRCRVCLWTPLETGTAQDRNTQGRNTRPKSESRGGPPPHQLKGWGALWVPLARSAAENEFCAFLASKNKEGNPIISCKTDIYRSQFGSGCYWTHNPINHC